MPANAKEWRGGTSHDRPVFLCLLEDDRLVTKISAESLNRLDPSPSDMAAIGVDVYIDVRVHPIHSMGNINYPMLYP
jgi:hypothetical protein